MVYECNHDKIPLKKFLNPDGVLGHHQICLFFSKFNYFIYSCYIGTNRPGSAGWVGWRDVFPQKFNHLFPVPLSTFPEYFIKTVCSYFANKHMLPLRYSSISVIRKIFFSYYWYDPVTNLQVRVWCLWSTQKALPPCQQHQCGQFSSTS